MSEKMDRFRTGVLMLFALMDAACGRAERTPSAESIASVSECCALEPYPLGRWRLAADAALHNVSLWASHIQIRHEGVESSQVPFILRPWRPDVAPSPRSRAEAFALARSVAQQARDNPAEFARLAREYSEDVTTRDRGGVLGALTATELSLQPEVLDAFAAMKPGEVSRVVESSGGFHVFQRHAPPSEGQVSGARIVIGYRGADMLPIVGGPEPESTRAQALATAESVYRELSKDPTRFDDFVLKFSEHPDAARKGDFGAWSTREVTKLAREVAQLLELDIGQIAPPLDSPEGFEIIRRTAPGPRQRYAAEVIALGFSRDAADSEPNSRASVLEAARGLLEQVQRDPREFDALRRRYCCTQVMDWYEGQDEPGRVTDVVAGLELGQIAAAPVESFNNIVVPRRVDPARAPARPPVESELPAPEHIDMNDLLRRSADSAGFVVDEFGQVADRFLAEMHAGADERAQLAALVAELDRTVERDSRIRQYERLLGHVREAYGPEGYRRYLDTLLAHFDDMYLRPSASPD